MDASHSLPSIYELSMCMRTLPLVECWLCQAAELVELFDVSGVDVELGGGGGGGGMDNVVQSSRGRYEFDVLVNTDG